MNRAGYGGVLMMWTTFLVLFFALIQAEESVIEQHSMVLDHTNFSDIVSKHEFILVQFYNPWCKHCKKLAPEYEKAASVLNKHDPPVIIAKVDVREEANEGLKATYEVQGVPSLKIFRNGGKVIQEYKGTREAEGKNGIIAYTQKQAGPASVEIKSVQDAGNFIDKKKIFVAGIFPEFSGEEYTNFTRLAEKLRGDYDFGHTTNAAFLPHGEVVDQPTVRLIKPFDELFVDFQDFQMDVLETFIEEASIPLVTIFDDDESNYDFVTKFLKISSNKALLFVNFSVEHDAFRSLYNEVAVLYKENRMHFLMGDVDEGESVIKYYQLKKDQKPLIIIQNLDGLKYVKTNLVPDEIAPWLKDYMDGQLKPYIKSQPIPEVNDKPLKVVVLNSLQEMIFKSEKNVLLQFYAPTCRQSRLLTRILDEVALAFEKDHDIMIAKLDATANDVPSDIFDVEEVPKLYFRSASGNLSEYDGDTTKEAIIDFIQNNRAEPAKLSFIEESQNLKDEL